MRSYENCEVQYCAVPSCASAQEGRNEEEEEEEEEGGGEEAQQEGRAESALARSAALRNSAPTPAPHLRCPSSTDTCLEKEESVELCLLTFFLPCRGGDRDSTVSPD